MPAMPPNEKRFPMDRKLRDMGATIHSRVPGEEPRWRYEGRVYAESTLLTLAFGKEAEGYVDQVVS